MVGNFTSKIRIGRDRVKNQILISPYDYNTLRADLLQNPGILGVAYGSRPFWGGYSRTDISWDGKNPSDETAMHHFGIGYDYIEVLGMEMAAGRNFPRDLASGRGPGIYPERDSTPGHEPG